MFSPHLEELILVAIMDGDLSENKRIFLKNKAASEGLDVEEFEMILNSRLKKQQKQMGIAPPVPGASLHLQNMNPTTSQSQKYGDVNKCPACGAPILPGTINCTECGHYFTNVNAVSSRERFANRLLQIEQKYSELERQRKQQSSSGVTGFLKGVTGKVGLYHEETYSEDRYNEIKMAIETFPIPNSKEDLIEFICFLKPKGTTEKKSMLNKVFSMDDDAQMDEFFDSYKMKYQECLTKASLYLKDDVQFAQLLEQNGIELEPKKKRGLF